MHEVRINNIAAVVILYNPDKTVVSNIKTYYPFVSKIYIFDNSEYLQEAIDWFELSKVEYYHNIENKGLAETLNIAARKAIEDGFQWLLTMDQDSCFSQENINNYFLCFQRFEEKNKVALFGPAFYYSDPGHLSDCSFEEVDLLITSGALMNLSVFNEIGCFDEALFIDSVDHDYCIRAKLKGYKVIQFKTIVLLHKLGYIVHRSSLKTLFLFKKEKALHSPLRCYYMLRNILYLQKKYKGEKLPALNEIKKGVKSRINRYLLYGRDSLQLIKYLRLAYRDFRNNRMGKFTGI